MLTVGYLAPLELVIGEEFHGDINVRIILEAMLMQKDNYGDLFNASFTIVPQNQSSHRVNVINSTHIELIVTYNTYYNVSAIGTVCGRTTELSTIQLLYSESH